MSSFHSLAGSVLVFLLGDIHTVEDDLTVCRLFQKVQASKKSGFTGTGRSDDYHNITFVDVDCHTIQSLDRALCDNVS